MNCIICKANLTKGNPWCLSLEKKVDEIDKKVERQDVEIKVIKEVK